MNIIDSSKYQEMYSFRVAGETYSQIAKRYKITKQRVHQILLKNFPKVQIVIAKLYKATVCLKCGKSFNFYPSMKRGLFCSRRCCQEFITKSDKNQSSDMCRCSHCKAYKTRDEVIIYHHRGDKVYYYCLDCNNVRKRKYYNEHSQSIYKIICKSNKKYPEKSRARSAIHRAINRNQIIKPEICQKCGVIKSLQGHHPNYLKPLEVVWLCKKCHKKEHINKQTKSSLRLQYII